jgi:pyridoxine 4-dehydrogenase
MPRPNAALSATVKIGGELAVHCLGFGAMRVTGRGVWGEPPDRAEALRTLRRLPALGVTFIDTPEFYDPDVSEKLLREAKHPYSDLVVATKGGLLRPGRIDGRRTPVG